MPLSDDYGKFLQLLQLVSYAPRTHFLLTWLSFKMKSEKCFWLFFTC